MLIFKKLTRFLRMHDESWFGPEQTEQNSIDEIAIITFGQLVIVGSRQLIIGPFNTSTYIQWTQHAPAEAVQ